MHFIVADQGHRARDVLENTVQAVFSAEFGARLHRFPARLVALLDRAGQPLAVAGLRFPGDSLFSEAYLDLPVEAALAAALRRPVDRSGIVEISSLAAVRAGAAMPLVQGVVRLCLAAGMTHGLFTATDRLRALLRRAGLACIDLGPAEAGRLADAADWGSYYLHDPRVVAVAAESLSGFRADSGLVRRHA